MLCEEEELEGLYSKSAGSSGLPLSLYVILFSWRALWVELSPPQKRNNVSPRYLRRPSLEL